MTVKNKKIEILNRNVVRIYEKKNDTSLFGLNDVKKEDDQKELPSVEILPDGSVCVSDENGPVFEETVFGQKETASDEKAAEYMLRAADSGVVMACQTMGFFYEHGQGLDRFYKIRIIDAPIVDISSTQIRMMQEQGLDASEYLM